MLPFENTKTLIALVFVMLSTFAEAALATIEEPQRTLPVTHRADVVVIGGTTGGLGGCFAAVAAARNGCSVIFIERFGTIDTHVPLALGVAIGNRGRPPLMQEGLFKDFTRYCIETGQYDFRTQKLEDVMAFGELRMRHHDAMFTAVLQMMRDAGVRMLFQEVDGNAGRSLRSTRTPMGSMVG
jgi:choline dehydrogenase-like flavoprotein